MRNFIQSGIPARRIPCYDGAVVCCALQHNLVGNAGFIESGIYAWYEAQSTYWAPASNHDCDSSAWRSVPQYWRSHQKQASGFQLLTRSLRCDHVPNHHERNPEHAAEQLLTKPTSKSDTTHPPYGVLLWNSNHERGLSFCFLKLEWRSVRARAHTNIRGLTKPAKAFESDSRAIQTEWSLFYWENS